MGGGLSANYVVERTLFTMKGWKISLAQHWQTHNPVCLWVLDYQWLYERMPDRADQSSYIAGALEGIKMSRRFRHPRVLKVLEVQDHPSYFEFTTEPFDACLQSRLSDGAVEKIETSYIGYQLADVMRFLHKAGYGHFGLSTWAVFLANGSVKLWGFTNARLLGEESPGSFTGGPRAPAAPSSAPELLLANEQTCAADVFSFGAVLFEMLTGKRAVTWAGADTCKPEAIQVVDLESSFGFVARCLSFEASRRPTFEELVGEPAFATTEVRVLRYLDDILVKPMKDKADFLRGLQKCVPSFSASVILSRLVPVLLAEIERDIRFAPLVLGPLIATGRVLAKADFEGRVFRRIASLVGKTEIPQILLAFLQQLDLLFACVEKPASVCPVLLVALEAPQAAIVKEALGKLPSLFPVLEPAFTEAQVLPLLFKVMQRPEVDLLAAALGCVVKSLEHCNHSRFVEKALPQLARMFASTRDVAAIPVLTDLLLKMKASDQMTLRYAVPLAAQLCTSVACDAFWQKQLSGWLLSWLTRWKESAKLDEVEDPVPKATAAVVSSEAAALFDPLREFGSPPS